MQVIRNERTVFCDVDETLVMHDLVRYGQNAGSTTVVVLDPYTNSTVYLIVNEPMERLFREELKRGATVFVWSRNGYQWAEAVLTAMRLDLDSVFVLSKPYSYFDDIPIEKWLTNRVYLKPDEAYKNG